MHIILYIICYVIGAKLTAIKVEVSEAAIQRCSTKYLFSTWGQNESKIINYIVQCLLK